MSSPGQCPVPIYKTLYLRYLRVLLPHGPIGMMFPPAGGGDGDGPLDRFLTSDLGEALLVARGVGKDGVDVDDLRFQG